MRLLILVLLIGQLFTGCNQKKSSDSSKVTTHEITSTEEVDEVSPPPPGLASNFKNVQEWLSNLCSLEAPGKSIINYDFGLFESPGNNYTAFVVGLNKYGEENHSVVHIDFESPNMYYQLPRSEYEGLDREQAMSKVKAELKNFIYSEKFKTSFFAQAKSITINSTDEIWSR
jgi:hypothetical protein